MSPAEQERKEVHLLERGHIYFFYRPRVDQDEPRSGEDIQNVYVVLSPRGKRLYRLAILGRRQLPDPAKRGERTWGFIAAVAADPEQIVRELGEETYTTRTRGRRRRPAARPAGEGVYAILRHRDHTHLAYALELPKRPGDVQEELGLEDEASYVFSVKNPDKPSPPNVGLPEKQRADYPERLKAVFGDRRFASVDPPELLDHQGAEFILISAADDVKAELGITLDKEDEDLTRAEILRDLRLERSRTPIQPLVEGKWA